jgi:hypothetical protein
MNSKTIKIPGPDHPITITLTNGRVTVTVNGKRVADTHEALTLKEAAYPAVQYIPHHVDNRLDHPGVRTGVAGDRVQEIQQRDVPCHRCTLRFRR